MTTKILVAFFALACVASVHSLLLAANQGYVSPDQGLAGDAPCDVTSISPVKVAVTTTTAATSSVMGKGKVRVVCSAAAFMVVGAVGVTGVTAGTSTGHRIPAGLPEAFWSRGSQFAFIRDSADGTCEIAQCR